MEQQGLYQHFTDPPKPSSPTPKDDKRANILCIISLACEFLPFLIASILSIFTSTITELTEVNVDTEASALSEICTNIFGTVSLLLMIAGLAIMIYVRVKYPKNVFGKVLMWLYIILGIISIIIFIVYILFIIWACVSCMSCINELG